MKQIKPWGWRQDILRCVTALILKFVGFLNALNEDHHPAIIYTVALEKVSENPKDWYTTIPYAYCTDNKRAIQIGDKLQADCREDLDFTSKVVIYPHMLDHLYLLSRFSLGPNGKLDLNDTTT